MVVSPRSLEELEGDLTSLKDSFRNGTISFSQLFGGSMKEPLSPQMNTNGPAHLTLRERVKTLIDLKRDFYVS